MLMLRSQRSWRGTFVAAANKYPKRHMTFLGPVEAAQHTHSVGSVSTAVTPRVHVLACATEYRQETAILQRSAVRNGFHFHAIGIGEPWGGFATKFLAYNRALERLVGHEIERDDVVMLMDAWDTVILGSAEELLDKIDDLPADAVFCGAERVCGPNHFLVRQMELLYPDGQTPWRYPNSGGLVARADAMADLLSCLVHDTVGGQAILADENDQVRLHDYLIARAAAGTRYPLRLDTRCRVFQCMYEEQPQWDALLPVDSTAGDGCGNGGGNGVHSKDLRPRIVNRVTGERPVVAHGNGHTGRWFLAGLYSELRLLDFLGLQMADLAHLSHEMPVAPGTRITQEVKEKYCPWWYVNGLHKGATDGFETFYQIQRMQCADLVQGFKL
eukprot:TRINITY_DN9279_c0_g1_i1.p1 TRINITY_DN9279_c0_g1~~TRINITY_DN9279_c0_g1_i1.p1  ORF type:complete len:386 (+),score=60.20 TRINITY_DN9279_c0_g1_i1:243-1400(+)